MIVKVYTNSTTHRDYTNVKNAAITDNGEVIALYTDTNGACHSVQDKSEVKIEIVWEAT